MNDPNTIPVSFEDMGAWLKRHKDEKSLSWTSLGQRMGVPPGTVSGYTAPSFAGNREKAAKIIYAYKQKVESQQAQSAIALEKIPFVETKTARRLMFLMEWAHGGRMTAAAMGPGTSKTETAAHYKASMGETVWHVEFSQSDKTVSAMIAAVMKVMGLSSPTGWVSQRSSQVKEYVRHRNGLLIADEANHLSFEAMEEMRAWHDQTGLGVFWGGNEELVTRVRGGVKNHAYARLNSRIAHFHIQDTPLEEDILAFLDANRIDDPAMIRPLLEVGLSPAHGGLREIRQVLESANIAAIGADSVCSAEHIKQAISSRTSDARRRR
jgi:DNA transposition AAA+ family ATPase